MTISKIGIIGGSGFLGSSLSTLFDECNIDYSIFDIENISNKRNLYFLI